MSTIRTLRPGRAGRPAGGEPPLLVDPTILAIFAATGDLANRKLLPALYDLAHDGALPNRSGLVGIARSEMTDEEFRAMAAAAVQRHLRRAPDDAVLMGLLANAGYVAGTFDQPELYEDLASVLRSFDERRTAGEAVNDRGREPPGPGGARADVAPRRRRSRRPVPSGW